MSDGKTRRRMNEREWECFEDGVNWERVRIRANIMVRVIDLQSCHGDDNCRELGDLIESYIPEWLGEDK